MTEKELLWKEIYNSIKKEIVLNKYKINKKLDFESDYAKKLKINIKKIKKYFK